MFSEIHAATAPQSLSATAPVESRGTRFGRVVRLATFLSFALGSVVGCSEADEDSDDPEATESEVSEGEPDDSGEAVITVTVDDGTVYELTDIRSCETSATHPSRYPLDNGYGISGWTADGAFRFRVGRAGLDDDDSVFSGSMEGHFDAQGGNNTMTYSLAAESSTLLADGATVTGSASSRAIGPTRPHGDNPVFTLEARCK